MNQDQFAFLQQIVETTGPSGYEEQAQQLWRQHVQDVASDIQTDTMGNCIAVLNPDGKPRVMIDAHIDEIGFQVKYIDDRGFIYFNPIGGFDPSTLAGNRVRLLGQQGPVLGVLGRKPIHVLEQEERKKAPEIKNLWIDIGVSNREEAEQLLAIGDAGGRFHHMERMRGNLVAGNSFDDRVGVYVMAETFRNLAQQKPQAGVYASSSVQEEIGLRGAEAATYSINPDIGIALEVTHATDYPQAPNTELGAIKIGAGPVITRGANTNPRVFQLLVDAAKAAGVPYQIEAEARGTGTDMNIMQRVRGGVATGLISIPLRYMHTSSEIISLDDVDAAVALLTRFVMDLQPGVNVIP